MDTPRAYVWRLQSFALGEHILTPSTRNQTPVKACAISACGNFAFLGTEDGWIERFNLQSGISRGIYLDASEGRSCAHACEVVGIACDATNSSLISAGYHGDIKVNMNLNTLCSFSLCFVIFPRKLFFNPALFLFHSTENPVLLSLFSYDNGPLSASANS